MITAWRIRYLLTGLIAVVLTAMPVTAAEKTSPPDNFGTAEWAAGHWQKAVHYLKYVSEDDQRKKLRSVPEHLREQAWNEFWKEADPLKSTDRNEYRQTYFERIAYANEHYETSLRDGWLSDQGEAYIRLGPPKVVDKLTMRAGGRDIHVWEYPTTHGLDLVFYDRTGVGDFRLLNPTDMIDEVRLYN